MKAPIQSHIYFCCQDSSRHEKPKKAGKLQDNSKPDERQMERFSRKSQFEPFVSSKEAASQIDNYEVLSITESVFKLLKKQKEVGNVKFLEAYFKGNNILAHDRILLEEVGKVE
ncbi:hypothetical protein K3495_g10109 [Podosphaera aphanis]|nr:hypothetical protein K3495_g10109 [Podosphaera aphanis]